MCNSETVTVDLGSRTYDIVIGEGVLARSGVIMADILGTGKAVVVTDERVASLPLGRLPNQHFTVLRKGHDRWCGPITFAVFDDLSRATVHNCDAGVYCPQINSDNVCHTIFLKTSFLAFFESIL